MTDEPQPRRGEAAWREQRDAIIKRNEETHKRARAEANSRNAMIAARLQADAKREAEQLRELNLRIARRQRRGQR